jgi:Family of unknown function (DUF5996)
VLPRQGRVRDQASMTLRVFLDDWARHEGHSAPVQPDPRQDPAGHYHPAQPLVERRAVRRRARPHHPAPAPSRYDLRDHDRLHRPHPDCPHPRRSHQVVRHRQRNAGRRPRCPLHAALSELGVDVNIKEEPFGVPTTTPFPHDVEHASWDREAIARFARILDWSDSMFEEFSGWFNGKPAQYTCSGTASTSLSPDSPGDPQAPIHADAVTQEAYTTKSSHSDTGPATTTSATPPTTPTPPQNPTAYASNRHPRASGPSPAPPR